MTRGFNYEMDKPTYDSMSAYSQSMYDLRQNSDIIYPVSKKPFKINNYQFFHVDNMFESTAKPTVFDSFKNNTSLTPKAMFDSAYQHHKDGWSGLKK